jgi:multimeric flavodoxin WrbA
MNQSKRRFRMNVIAINGSARKDGNTAILINVVFDELKKEGIETEMIQLAGNPIQGCMLLEQEPPMRSRTGFPKRLY